MDGRTKGVLVYLLLAFGLAWVLWEIPIQLGLSVRDPLFQLAVLPGGFAPAVAAIVVRKWITREGFGDAGLRLNRRRWPHYLVGWLFPLVASGCIVALAALLGIGRPDFTLERALRALAPAGVEPPAPVPWTLWLLIPVQSLVVAVLATPLLWGEEFGWRGYLQMRLFSDRPLLAALATGVIWGIWHYPINLRGYNFPESTMLGLVVFPISTVLVSIILGWLRLRTGSVWAASLGHAATNAVGGSLTTLLFAGGPNMIYVGYLGLLGWVPLGLFCAWIIFTGQLRVEDNRRLS